MSDGYYLDSGAHMLITGATGAGDEFGGKTVLANWLLDNAVRSGMTDSGVFINPKGHVFVRGTVCRSRKEIVEAWQSGDRLFNYVPGSPAADHADLVKMFRQVPGSTWLVHDEAHAVADSDPLDWCFRQGGNVGNLQFRTDNMRSIAVTQHPWDLPESVSQNAPLKVWVGPTTPESRRYFQTMQISEAYDTISSADSDPYEWWVIDGGEVVDRNAPVPEAYAQ